MSKLGMETFADTFTIPVTRHQVEYGVLKIPLYLRSQFPPPNYPFLLDLPKLGPVTATMTIAGRIRHLLPWYHAMSVKEGIVTVEVLVPRSHYRLKVSESHTMTSQPATLPSAPYRPVETTSESARSSHLSLRPWQQYAVERWLQAGGRGIVSAPTGTGKTRLAIAAWRSIYAEQRNVRTRVIVPTIELAEQWGQEFGSAGGGRPTLVSGQHARRSPHATISVYVVNSARTALGPDVTADAHNKLPTFLIADECHRLGSPRNALALQAIANNPKRFTLGLSATPERDYDDGFTDHIVPYIGEVVYTLAIRDAVQQGYMSKFTLNLVQVEMLPLEADRYQKLSDTIRNLRHKLEAIVTLPSEFPKQMAYLQKLAGGDPETMETRYASQYLDTIAKRHVLSMSFVNRLHMCRRIAQHYLKADGGRGILFVERIEDAERLASNLSGLPVAAYHSQLPHAQREDRLARLKRGNLRLLVACHSLDEGIDVPAVDFAVIVFAGRSRRRLIQRMGRTLRTRADGSAADIWVIQVVNADGDVPLSEQEIRDLSEVCKINRYRDRGDGSPQ